MENDLISRNALIERCNGLSAVEWNKKAAPISWADAYEHFADELENAPAVAAVEVVRCRDCKHWKHFDHLGCTDFVKVCGLANYMIGANGYCLYADRRDDNG